MGQIAARCTEVDSGARNVDRIITGTLQPEISRELIGWMASGKAAERLRVTVEPDGRSGTRSREGRASGRGADPNVDGSLSTCVL